MTMIVQRVNGSDTDVGNLYNLNANVYVVTVRNAAGVAKNLTTEDSAGGDAVINGVVESIVRELCPLIYLTDANQVANTGKIYMVVDKSLSSDVELQTRIRRLGTTVGPNNVDVTGSTVTAATTLSAT